ncbi:hypothetical protein KOW79_004764 [Hemibagrus wyckioides]|uniref:Glutaminase n=1 Tax=Hemibagrus wyckioides TaxID=337641 RepID=A0A9D3P0R3_9TELE|nr:hypothetical protein KOW79_004764 [Hemibagrus wyckioides]
MEVEVVMEVKVKVVMKVWMRMVMKVWIAVKMAEVSRLGLGSVELQVHQSLFSIPLQVKSVINLLFAAYTGDVSALRRFALSSMDMEQKDYDSRTALHVAAAEGHVDVVRFLLEACKVNPVPKDRWGNTPLDEATHFGHHEVVTLLQEFHNKYTPVEKISADKDNATKNLDSMLET